MHNSYFKPLAGREHGGRRITIFGCLSLKVAMQKQSDEQQYLV
jgi:hypothetical protein